MKETTNNFLLDSLNVRTFSDVAEDDEFTYTAWVNLSHKSIRINPMRKGEKRTLTTDQTVMLARFPDEIDALKKECGIE
jgi:hypothetical protein